MEEKNIFFNAEGAFNAIEDALKYLGDNDYMEGFLVLHSTKKSGVDEMMQLFADSELDVVTCLMKAALKSELVKNAIMNAGTIIAQKWEEFEAGMAKLCELQEEETDE